MGSFIKKIRLAPPLYKCVLVLCAVMSALALAACARLGDDDAPQGYAKVTASGMVPRAIGEAERSGATLAYSFNGRASGGNETLAEVGSSLRIRVVASYGGKQIATGEMTHKVVYGRNNVTVILREDRGQQPSAPQPVAGRVMYELGEATVGTATGLPTDTTTYKEGEVFTVESGATMTWQHGLNGSGFREWRASPAIAPENGGAATTAPQAGQKYKMPAGGVVLTAQWNKTAYKITYNANAPTFNGQTANVAWSGDNPTTAPASVAALSSTTIFNGTSPTASGINTKNYTFTGWNTDQNGTNGTAYSAGQTISQMTGDIILYAQWRDKNVYTVTYDMGSGGPSSADSGWKANDTYIEGSATGITLPTLTATGYDFLGWQTDTGTPVTSPYIPAAGVTLRAQWKIKTYNITYSMNAPSGATGTSGTVSPTQREYMAGFTLATNTFIVPGYDFMGWYRNDGGYEEKVGNSGDTVSSQNFTYVASDLALYAKWNAQQYNISYYDADASSATARFSGTHGSNHPTQHTYGTDTTLVEPTKPNYKFLGWFTANNGSGSPVTELAATAYTGSITLYAKWEPKQYNISYNFGSGQKTTDGDATFTIETTSITFATGALQDYVLSAWKVGNTYVKNTDISQLVSLAENSGDSITLEAEFLPSGKMIIESKAVITGRGTTVTGNIPPGMTINVNDTVTIQRGDGSTKGTVITGIEKSGTQVADTMTATEKTTVTLLLRGVAESEVNPNDVLAW